VCDDNNLDKYVNILKENNYDSYVLKEYDTAIDYDTLDVRIFLIEKGDFIKFISEYIDNDKVYFYNSIIIQFDNDNDNDNDNGNDNGNDCDIIGEADRIKREYKKISNNNEIII
jgi:hypothetical protein